MDRSTTPETLRAWRAHMGLSRAQAADALGISVASLAIYERGERFDGRPFPGIPLAVGLACAALAHGLSPMARRTG